MSINKDKLIELTSYQNGTMKINLEHGIGEIEIRKYIDEPTQELFADFVSKHVFGFEGGKAEYHPIRKDALMLLMFLKTFVVNGEELIVSADDNEADLYATYNIIENQLGLMSTARDNCHTVDAILTRIESAVDLMIFYEKDHMNAATSGGLTGVSMETIENINEFINKASEVSVVLKEVMEQNGAKLSKLLTKKNVDKLISAFTTSATNPEKPELN